MANLLAKQFADTSFQKKKSRKRKAEKEKTQITINKDNMEPYNCPITEEELEDQR
jgi:uncharacterized protein YlaN (UPF0358 family)